MRVSAGALLLSLLLAGCATATGTGTHTQALDAKALPRTLAVLPFVPMPEKEEQARVLGRMIYGALSATPYDVVKPQVVEERLVRAGLGDPKAVAAKDPAELAKILKVDALLYGELTHWDRLFLAVYAQVAAGAHIRLVDARNGQTLFERQEVQRSHEGGVPTNAISAAIQLVQSALKLREIELIRACDDLVRALLKGVPAPPALEARRPPGLGNVLSDGGGRLLKVGDTITVIAQGQAGAIGSFDVVPLTTNLALEETSEGVYIGRYSVKPGDNAPDVYVLARLADGVGRFSERDDLLGRFSVDTVPPAPPSGIAAALRDTAIQLSWAAGGETDLAAYRVYRSTSQLTGFTLIATTEATIHRDPLEGVVYYRLTAVDRAGNESAPSASVALAVLAPVLSGTITTESYLVPAHSPYTLSTSLTVDQGATLHILPGVVVRVAPGAEGILVKDGRLIARGTAERRITFTSGSERPGPGDFRSAVQIRAKAGQTSALEYVTVQHGGAGVRLESGGLEVLGADILANLQGGIVVSDTGVLKVSESRITGHTSGGGVTVQGFGRAVLRGNRIAGNGWAVVNYSGNQVDARGNWWGSATPADGLFVGDVDRREPLTTDGTRGATDATRPATDRK
jgi:hypothetical protein